MTGILSTVTAPTGRAGQIHVTTFIKAGFFSKAFLFAVLEPVCTLDRLHWPPSVSGEEGLHL